MDWLIGKTYCFRSFNCWDYVGKIREQAGIKTPLFNANSLNSSFDLIGKEQKEPTHNLKKADKPKNLDIVITHKKKGDKYIYHCGIYFNNEVRHCSLAFKQVINESFSDFIKKYDGYNLWR